MISGSEGRIQYILIAIFLLILVTSGNAADRYKMYVPHPLDADDGKSVVSVYDLKENRLISTIGTVTGASFARSTPNGEHVWVFSGSAREAEIFAVLADEPAGKPYLDHPASDAVFDPDGSVCYTANGSLSGDGDNSISFIDVESMVASYTIATGKNPIALAIRKDGSRLYVANRDDNSITVIDPDQFRVVTTWYAGIEPQDLKLSNAERYLFVSNGGVDYGNEGGSGVTVIETETGRVIKVIKTGLGPRSIDLTSDGKRMVVSHSNPENQESLWLYDLEYEGDRIISKVTEKIAAADGAGLCRIDPSERWVVIPDYVEGGVYTLDIVQPAVPTVLAGLQSARAYSIGFAAVDVESDIARLDTIIANNPAGPEARSAAFQKAYLYNTLGDQNAVVAAYDFIVDTYPGTIAEAKALFKMGDLCYDQQLVSNAADYYNRGLVAYGELLKNGSGNETLESEAVLTSAGRLGELALKLDHDYFDELYKLYSGIPLKLSEFPQLFFTYGVALEKLDNSKYAKKCFEETENRLIELMDEDLYLEMRFRLDLVRSHARVMMEAEKMKRSVTPDGILEEWDNAKPLMLDRRDNVIVNRMRWLDRTDISGSFMVAYDQYNLYVAGSVADDKLFRRDSNGDYVAIYLDVRDGSGEYVSRDAEFGDGVYSIFVIPPSDNGSGFEVHCDQQMEPMVGGIKSAEGYDFELKIPLAYLKGFTPKENDRIGFGIELFDVDSGNTNDPPKVVGWLMPAKSAYGPRFSELFGILEF